MNKLRRKKKLGSRFSKVLRHQKSNLKTEAPKSHQEFLKQIQDTDFFFFFKAFGFLSKAHFGKIILTKVYFG